MKKIIYSAILSVFALVLLGSAPKALADCQTVYGGGEVCTYNFTVQKFVQVPSTGQYVNNIYDAEFSPSQDVNFKLVLTNTGSNTIPSLSVVDTFPQYVSFVSGVGNYNSSNNTLNFTVSNLNPGQTVSYVITGKIADQNTIPGTVCVINQVSATDVNGQTQSASSNLCIQKSYPTPTVAPSPRITTTPPTGPEMLPLLALLPGGLGGMFLRRKSKNLTHFKGGEK